MIATIDENAAATPEALLHSLRWRYAVKKFDADKEIPERSWKTLEEALVLAPSSYGLQPWKFFVIEDPAMRAKLREASWGQSQITDAAKLVVFAARKNFGAADIERFVARTAEVRGVAPASLQGMRDMMVNSITGRPAPAVESWVARQVYIALGVFLASAAALGVDACPMEGIDPAQYDKILGLDSKGYAALFVATAGYRAPDDKYAQAKKVRFSAEHVIEHV